MAITYTDPLDEADGSCIPYYSITGFGIWPLVDTLYAGVNIDQPSTGTLENDPDLCGPDYGSRDYTTTFSAKFYFDCGYALANVDPDKALRPTVTDTLLGCMNYCNLYPGCHSVEFSGSPPQSGQLNCFTFSEPYDLVAVPDSKIQAAYTNDDTSIPDSGGTDGGGSSNTFKFLFLHCVRLVWR